MNNLKNFLNKIGYNKDFSKCWYFTGYIRKKDNYGQVTFLGKSYLAHRLSWKIFYNKNLDNNKVIRHVCDNKLCCNPFHLIEGTRKDNALDRILHGDLSNKYKIKKDYVTKNKCKNGHLYTEETLRKQTNKKTGKETFYCRKCASIRSLNNYYKNRGKNDKENT